MKLAIFDFDGTLIRGDSIVPYLLMARRQRLMTLKQLWAAGLAALRCKAGTLDRAQAKGIALSFRAKWPAQRLEQLDQAFAAELLERVRPKALEEMRARRAAGDLVVLLSASTDHYMRFVASGLPADRLICSRTDEKGSVLLNVHGEEKVRQLQAFLDSLPEKADLKESSAYGDSASDLPLLLSTGHPYLVNPKRKAKRLSQGKIPILRW